ncbi:hypothetical protein L1887_42612 [Cichorium endivia]|nr:hypothetical protein L1887_42612 [Cichorium endivia]
MATRRGASPNFPRLARNRWLLGAVLAQSLWLPLSSRWPRHRPKDHPRKDARDAPHDIGGQGRHAEVSYTPCRAGQQTPLAKAAAAARENMPEGLTGDATRARRWSPSVVPKATSQKSPH